MTIRTRCPVSMTISRHNKRLILIPYINRSGTKALARCKQVCDSSVFDSSGSRQRLVLRSSEWNVFLSFSLVLVVCQVLPRHSKLSLVRKKERHNTTGILRRREARLCQKSVFFFLFFFRLPSSLTTTTRAREKPGRASFPFLSFPFLQKPFSAFASVTCLFLKEETRDARE